MSDDPFLSRWSRRKIQARKGEAIEEAPPPVEPEPPAAPVAAAAPSPAPPEPLPPVESLNPESDFTPFMKPEVDGGLRNEALKTLFKDPRYNVMDGLDVYIDDYSKPDPLPAGWLEKMTQMARLGAWEPPAEPSETPEKPLESVDQVAAAELPEALPAEPLGDEPQGPPEAEDMKPTS